MSERLQKPDVSEADEARSFLEFQYIEVKDLTKQFLTVVAAVLAVSVTFSEKIINFAQGKSIGRALMMSTWGLCLAALVLGGLAIFLIFNAGVLAKNTLLYGTPHKYLKLTVHQLTEYSYKCLNVAGVSFVVALGLLVLAGLLRIM